MSKLHTEESRKRAGKTLSEGYRSGRIIPFKPMLGRHHSKETRARMSISMTGKHHCSYKQSQETVMKKSEYMKNAYRLGIIVPRSKAENYTPEVRAKISKALTGKKKSLESRIKQSESRKSLFSSDEKFREIVTSTAINNIRLAGRKPNLCEEALNKILQKLFPNEWRYVGDFKIWIAGRNPDFININGQKKIIELFGNKWHKVEDEVERISHYRQFGFDTLVVWASELKNTKELEQKLISFC